jgi:hypothetical protein
MGGIEKMMGSRDGYWGVVERAEELREGGIDRGEW